MERGDHIYFRTKLPGNITHHGIYCGNNLVIHFDGNAKPKAIKKVSLEKFSKPFGVDVIEVLEYGWSDSADTVILRAESLVEKTQYDVANRNCEHFTVYCKTGDWRSPQIEAVESDLIDTENSIRTILRPLIYNQKAILNATPTPLKPVVLAGLGLALVVGGVSTFIRTRKSHTSRLPEE